MDPGLTLWKMDLGWGTLRRGFYFPCSAQCQFQEKPSFLWTALFSSASSLSCCPLWLPSLCRVSDDLLFYLDVRIFPCPVCVSLTTPGIGRHTDAKCLLLGSLTQKTSWDVWPLIFTLLYHQSSHAFKEVFFSTCYQACYSVLVRMSLHICSV